MNHLLGTSPRFLFFTGKGGVGKTSMSCATAVALADLGKKALLVSTDPASNLDEVLGTTLTSIPTPVIGVERLYALNIDPIAAAAEYRESIVAPFRGVLPDAAVTSIEEQLSGACTVEIASFNEFSKLLSDSTLTDIYDHIILDTAPTGHTLRLLSLPAAWKDFIANNKSGSSCLGPLSGLKDQRESYEKTVTALQSPEKTLLFLVTRPDKAALKEAAKASVELYDLGIQNQKLIVNGYFETSDTSDKIAKAFSEICRQKLQQMPEVLQKIPTTTVAFRPHGFLGIDSLREIYNPHPSTFSESAAPIIPPLPPSTKKLDELIDPLALAGKGVIMTMGKGGVGKTTLAAAISIRLAELGHRVLLSTTDPAAHLDDALSGSIPNLTVSRIDPIAATQAHKEQVMKTAGAHLDAEARALLEEELRSPCTEEIAVFKEFAQTIARGEEQFVVLDTAPTGHTLLLLDATESYNREVSRSTNHVPDAVKQLLPRLQNPQHTRILLITLPEATPVHEARQLQEDLQRAKITPYAWIINQCFCTTGSEHPLLKSKATNEIRYINEVVGTLASHTVLIPWLSKSPTGIKNLRQLFAPNPIS